MLDNYNSDDVSENGVSENDTLNNSSDDENIMGVEVSGEVISVNELEREWKESLSEYGGQRANFPYGICGVKAPQVFIEDESSSVGDEVSPKTPLSFCDFPGKARMGFSNVVLPSVWNESCLLYTSRCV